ncbi:MAG: hypothetical protein LBQ67_06445 [Treponema sp.]|jgi:hypothetical protein|nr:hypothetical protein [Treponema sp.]
MKKIRGLFLLIALFSCKSEKSGPAGPLRVPAPPQAAVRREAVLARGNGWVAGIPGFGSNAFPALAGEYRLGGLEPKAAEEGEKPGEAVFSVHASREALFFSDLWRRRPGTGSGIVFQRFEGNALLAAAVLEAGPLQGSWTVIFQFPGGIAEAGLEEAAFSRLIDAWCSRFLYFASLIKTPGDVSLPAVVAF